VALDLGLKQVRIDLKATAECCETSKDVKPGWIKHFFGEDSPQKVQQEHPDVRIGVRCFGEEQNWESTIYDRNPVHYSGAIKLIKECEESSQHIEINLEQVPQKIQELCIVIYIHQAVEKGQHLDKLDCSGCITECVSGEKLHQIGFYKEFQDCTGVFVADILRQNEKNWSLQLIEEGCDGIHNMFPLKK